MKTSTTTLLARLRRRHTAGLLLAGFLRVLSWGILAFLLYALCDLAFALSGETRLRVNRALLVGLVAALVSVAFATVVPALRRFATGLDKDRERSPILTALELEAENEPEPTEGLGAHLRDHAMAKGRTVATELRWRDLLPLRTIRRQGLLLCGLLLLAGMAYAIGGADARTTLGRLLHPGEDRPPPSPWTFHLDPAEPEVLYGRGLELAVDIEGPATDKPVWLWTQATQGEAVRTACFRDGEQRYAQKLESVTEPLTFWFATGRGRSTRQPIKLVLQPEIDRLEWEMRPPIYTRLGATAGTLGKDGLQGYAGSQLSLTVRSNRPLRDGLISAHDLEGNHLPPIHSTPVDANTVRFTWTLEAHAELRVRVRDVRGVWSAALASDGVAISQRVIEDAPPEVRINEPGAYVLATPDSTLQLRGDAEDDLGLATVHIARTLTGFRDRLEPLPVLASMKQQPVERPIELGRLGVKSGDVLEFYLEATDHNPNRLGRSASELVKVQIIDHEEYAAMLRNKTAARELAARFNKVMEAQREAREALEEMKKAGESEDKEAAEAARKAAEEAMKRLAELSKRLSEDFPLYELEKEAVDELKKLAKQAKQQAGKLAEAAGAKPQQLAKMAEQMLKDAERKAAEENMEQLAKDAKAAAAAADLLMEAQAFQRLYLKQRELARRLQRHVAGGNERELRALGEQQEELREQLGEWSERLSKKLAELPEEDIGSLEELRSSTQEFLDALEQTDPSSAMRDAADAADQQEGPEAHKQAAEAQARMEQMFSKCKGCFGGACKGPPKFNVKDPLSQTAQQMLNAMRGKSGPPGKGGSGSGMGSGAGGGPDDGYSMQGQSSLDLPVLGPERSRLSMEGLGTGDSLRGGGAGNGTGGRGLAGDIERGTMDFQKQGAGTRAGVPREQTPPRYRDAIQRYFLEQSDAER